MLLLNNIHAQYERNTQTFSYLLSVLFGSCKNSLGKRRRGRSAGHLGGFAGWGSEKQTKRKYPTWKYSPVRCSERGEEVSKMGTVTCNWLAVFHQPIFTVKAPDYIRSLSSLLSRGMWIMGSDTTIKISLVSWFQLVSITDAKLKDLIVW